MKMWPKIAKILPNRHDLNHFTWNRDCWEQKW